MTTRPPREPGTLKIGDALRRRIARLRHLDVHATPPVVDVQLVRAIESKLECVLEDDVLALLASGTVYLSKEANIDAEKVLDQTKSARTRGCPDELVAIGAHPAGLEYYCVARNRVQGDPLLLVEFACGDRSLTGQTIVEWVEGRLESLREALATGNDEERKLSGKTPSVAEIQRFQPAVVEVPPAAAPSVRMVRHAIFGLGEVLNEVSSGHTLKLNVKFEAGTKLLLATVLEEVVG